MSGSHQRQRRHCGSVAFWLVAIALAGCEPETVEPLPDTALSNYLQSVAAALAPDRDVPSIEVVRGRTVQASADPAGRIIITTGMLGVIANEAELACVLGHEMAHLQLDHTPRSATADSTPPLEGFPRWAPDQEAAADSHGLALCAAAGYAPTSAANLLYRLALRRDEAEGLEPSLNSAETRRIQALLDQIQAQGYAAGKFGHAEYASAILSSGLPVPDMPYDPSGLDFLEEEYVDSEYQCLGLLLHKDAIYANGVDASRTWVETACEDTGIDAIPSNHFDAFGHCWFGCESRRVSENCGNPGAYHEVRREVGDWFGGPEHDSFWEDWHNQNTGVWASRREEGSCYAICERAIEGGRLDLTAPERYWVDCDTLEQVDDPGDASVPDFGSSSVYGEPHLITLDGLRYDFQAAGEFVALRSRTDELEVQVRLSAVPSQAASRTTAIALNVHGDRIGAYVAGDEFVVRLDGVVQPARSAWVNLANGGAVQVHGDRVIVRWPDDTSLTAYGSGDVVDLSMHVSPRHRGATSGLLGNFDGDPDNEFISRAGESVTLDGLSEPLMRVALYETFGSTWRVDEEESLFDYEDGRSTADYQIEGFPDRIVTLDDLPPDAVEAATRHCLARGVAEPEWRDACVFDVAVTGDGRYADSSARIASGASGAAPMYASTATIGSAGSHTLETFEATRGQRYFFRKADVADTLGLANWELAAPDGASVFRQCVVNCNEPGEFELPLTGTYSSRLTTDEGEVGAITVIRSRVPEPQRFELTESIGFDSDRAGTGAGDIEVPGAVDIYRFNAEAGATLQLTLEARDDRLYFGRWRLTAPGSQTLFDEILPSSGSSRREELTATGQYELLIDGGDSWPSGDDYGYGKYRMNVAMEP